MRERTVLSGTLVLLGSCAVNADVWVVFGEHPLGP
jgi:hypothetical protein